MAVRIEFFTLTGTTDFEVVPSTTLDNAVAAFEGGHPSGDGRAVRCVGWVSASDDDEELFTGWCEAVDEHLGLGLLHQGLGEDAGLDAQFVPPAAAEPEVSWSATLQQAVEAADRGRIGWRTNFDPAGTVGTIDDYPTASHRTT